MDNQQELLTDYTSNDPDTEIEHWSTDDDIATIPIPETTTTTTTRTTQQTQTPPQQRTTATQTHIQIYADEGTQYEDHPVSNTELMKTPQPSPIPSPQPMETQEQPTQTSEEEQTHPTCYGCYVKHPSQKQHMDYGGCLYVEDDDLSEPPPKKQKTQQTEVDLAAQG